MPRSSSRTGRSPWSAPPDEPSGRRVPAWAGAQRPIVTESSFDGGALMAWGALLAALSLGFRHGLDWDHLAAISDLTTSAGSRRRGFSLSMVYAVGHAIVVFVLGAGVIAFGATLPSGTDDWMGRAVGLTLVLLGLWVVVDLVRQGRDFRLRSRWMLVLDGTFAGLRRVRTLRSSRTISIEHEHEHEHVDGTRSHADAQAHDHAHATADVVSPRPVLAGAPRSSAGGTAGSDERGSHRHRHRHDLQLPLGARGRYSTGSAVGVGMVHGVGVESPTQIAVFVAASSVSGTAGAMALLVCWIAGLVAANAVLAVGIGVGLVRAERNFGLYAFVAVAAASVSVALGASLLLGGGGLPALGS